MTKFKGKIIIGITGGIGSGKSVVSKMLSKRGFKIYYADLIAKNLYLTNKSLLKKIVKQFGGDVLNFKGKINLSKLKEKIFESKRNYEAINKIVHPVVINFIKDEIKKSEYDVIIIESALAFESDLNKIIDYVVLVYSNKKTRIERLMLRDEARRQDILNVMKFQMDEKKKLEKADFILMNNKTVNDLQVQVDFLGKIIKSLNR